MTGEYYPPMSPSKFQILLVDDSETDAKLCELALREAAPRVKLYWVASAREGLEYLHQENRFQGAGAVSLIICDLNMPDMSGFEFLAKVKKDEAVKALPLVMYSASSSPRDIRLCYTLGANSYMVKAITMEAIVQQLKSLVHYWLEVVSLPGTFVID